MLTWRLNRSMTDSPLPATLRPPGLAPLDTVDDPLDALDDAPPSAVRSVGGDVQSLVVDTGLGSAAADTAWVTVTGPDGNVLFEGPPSVDGCVQVSFAAASHVERVRVLLETATQHRQAEVVLRGPWTTHVFERSG